MSSCSSNDTQLHLTASVGNFTQGSRLHTKHGKKAYFQCLDPRPPYTEGGTVLFRIVIESQDEIAHSH